MKNSRETLHNFAPSTQSLRDFAEFEVFLSDISTNSTRNFLNFGFVLMGWCHRSFAIIDRSYLCRLREHLGIRSRNRRPRSLDQKIVSNFKQRDPLVLFRVLLRVLLCMSSQRFNLVIMSRVHSFPISFEAQCIIGWTGSIGTTGERTSTWKKQIGRGGRGFWPANQGQGTGFSKRVCLTLA